MHIATLLLLLPPSLLAQEIYLNEDPQHEHYGQLVVEGISLGNEAPEQLLQVYVGNIQAGQPAVWGKYFRQGQQLRFKPRFPFELAQVYTYRLIAGGDTLTASFQVQTAYESLAPVVMEIQPANSSVPVNLLRFYIFFSQPMRKYEVYQHLYLLNQQGDTIKNPFYPADPPLWDQDGRRLTLLLDPGRIKTGLDSHEAWGLALEEGQSYQLLIDRHMMSYRGGTLEADFLHPFSTLPKDLESPRIEDWTVVYPDAGTKQVLQITFDEPLDRAQASRWIKIQDQSGNELEGAVSFTPDGDFQFKPLAPWQEVHYVLLVNNQLEDLAGNSIRKPFEMGAGGTEKLPAVQWLKVDFQPL